MVGPGKADPLSPSVPRDAASVLLLRDGVTGLEVLMVRRHESSRDFAGASVFPGGLVEVEDADPRGSWIGDAFDAEAARRDLGEELDEERVRAIHACACRELHEEACVRITADRLVPIARWITPAHQPRRWDTRFFLAADPDAQEAAADGAETCEAVWLTAEGALAAYRAGAHLLAPPTFRLLEELARFPTAERAFAETRASGPPRPILPVPLADADELTLVYPGDREYPGESAVGRNRIVMRDRRWLSIRE
jgi:8-oxo-dGTP pyrophosphatase MutT (NUDIX family)